MQNGLYVLNFGNIKAGFVSGYIYFNNTIPLANAAITSLLNNKEFHTDNNGHFDFGFPEGEHSFLVNNEETITITFEAHQYLITDFYIGNELIPGDINNDSIINVLDVILIVSFIMQTSEPTQQEQWTSDVNQDTIINIQDIILIIQLILNSK